jgi:succinyl-CoA synthetase beta subunit
VAVQVLGLTIQGVRVRRVLVVEALAIASELYLGLTVDRAAKQVSLIFSASGGIDIEEVAARAPGSIRTLGLKSAGDLGPDDLNRLFAEALPDPDTVQQAAQVAAAMVLLFWDKDCSLVEINPLVLTAAGRIVAADAKVVLDDNGLPRHPELESLRNEEEYSADELEAHAAGLSFVALDGEIGCMVNGAGLAMATMDCIRLFGGTPANFLDVGGSSNPNKVLTGLKILLRNPRTRAILINIFGGITRCDDIARGILLAREQIEIPVPVVIRLTGTNEQQGRSLLTDAGLAAAGEMTEAVRNAIACLGRGT